MDDGSIRIKSGSMNLITLIISVMAALGGTLMYMESRFASIDRVKSVEDKIDVIYNYVLNKK